MTQEEIKAIEAMNNLRLDPALQQSIRDNEAANEQRIQYQERERAIALQAENDRASLGLPEISFENVDIAMEHEKERQRLIGEQAWHFHPSGQGRYDTEQEWEARWNNRIKSHKTFRTMITESYNEGIQGGDWSRTTFKKLFSQVRHGISEDDVMWHGGYGQDIDRNEGILDEILHKIGDRNIISVETRGGEYSIYIDENTGCYLCWERGDEDTMIENIWGIFGPGGVIEKSSGVHLLRSIDDVLANPPKKYKYR